MEFLRRNSTNIARVLLLAVFLYLAGLAIWLDFAYSPLSQWVISKSAPGRLLAHALINVAPELAGIVIGVVTIDYLNERRQDEQLKRQLILQMGSGHNDVTDTAIRTLNAYGWLQDGSLREANFFRANLSRAIMWEADLSSTFLASADLSGANLLDANLSGSILSAANLSGSILFGANLSSAQLVKADLRGADLSEACLSRADISGARLHGATLKKTDLRDLIHWERWQLLQAESLEGAIMPDGRKYEEWIKDFKTGENSESI